MTAWQLHFTESNPMITITISGSNKADRIIGVADRSNHLVGYGGNDTIIGGNFSDIIRSGSGADQLHVTRGSVDRFIDFIPSQDRLVFKRSEFPGIRTLTNVRPILLSRAAATKLGLIYAMGSGQLYWNANGAAPGWGVGGLVAVLGKPGSSIPFMVAGESIAVI